MLPVISPWFDVVLQPTSRAARLTNASVCARRGGFFMASRPSIQNEAVLAVVGPRGSLAARPAVEAVQASEQNGGRIGCVGEAVVRSRQVLLGDRARDVRRDDHHQLG